MGWGGQIYTVPAPILDLRKAPPSPDQLISAGSELVRGLPIGNLTSQLFANIYLNELDQFVKHTLREPYYIRYMDDFLVLHHDKAHLQQVLGAIQQFCERELKLTLHPKKTEVHMFVGCERFVGYDLGPYLRRLSKPTLQRFVKRIKKLQVRDTEAAAVSIKQFKAYASFAHTKGLLAKWDGETI